MGLLFWLFTVILWCAFGIVEQADHLSELLGEPIGTLVLTLSIVTIEVALIGAVMLDSHAGLALGRDTMFAVLMIVLNGVGGLALLLGGLRYGEQSYNLQGAVAYLAIIVPGSVIALVLPSFILSTSDGTLTKIQSIFFSLFTILLYGVFLAVLPSQHKFHQHIRAEMLSTTFLPCSTRMDHSFAIDIGNFQAGSLRNAQSRGLGSNDSGTPFHAESEQILYNSRFAASASFAMLMSNALNSGGWPMNSPDAIRKLAAPSASICPGEVGRITAHRGKFGLMNSQGTGKIRLV
jgi:hypothetical protein